jgi:phosphotransacetylase
MRGEIETQNDIVARYDEILSTKASKHSVDEVTFELRQKYDEKIEDCSINIQNNIEEVLEAKEQAREF